MPNQNIMPAYEAIDGRKAIAYATIKGKRYQLFQLKSFETKTEKNNVELQRLGTTVAGNLTSGIKLSWEAEMYYNTDIFRALAMEYLKTGKETYFDLQVTNDDPNSSAGRHTVILRDCKINNINMAMINVENQALTEKVDGTCEDIDAPELFKVLEGMNE